MCLRTDQPIVWAADCLIRRLSDQPVVWSADCLISRLSDQLIVWSADQLIVWSTDCLISWLSDQPIVWSADCLISRLSDQPIVWSADCLISWLLASLFSSSSLENAFRLPSAMLDTCIWSKNQVRIRIYLDRTRNCFKLVPNQIFFIFNVKIVKSSNCLVFSGQQRCRPFQLFLK